MPKKETKNIEKVIVLAAGASSRFWPLSKTKHKAFYKAGTGLPIIAQTIHNLLSKHTSIKDIFIIVSPGDKIYAEELFKEFNEVKVLVHEGAKGQGNAILEAFKYLDPNEPVFIVTPEKINAWQILSRLLSEGEAIALRTTNNPKLYGIVNLDKSGDIKSLIEKPNTEELTGLKITGAYLLNSNFLKLLKKNTSDHYSLEKTLGEYIKNNKIKGVLIDDILEFSLKYPWQILEINRKILSSVKADFIHPTVQIASTSKIVGPVIIQEGSVIGDFVKIVGPVFIGKHAVIGDYSLVRDSSFIDDKVLIGANSEIKNSVIYKGVHTHKNFIGDSILDEDCRIGAGTITANRRIDRSEIKTKVKGETVTTGLTSFGAILGKDIKIGVNCSLMPGVKLGSDSQVFPANVVFEDIEDKGVVK